MINLIFNKKRNKIVTLVWESLEMRMYQKNFALFFLILAACVPQHTEAESPAAKIEKTEQKSVPVGNYLLYLQAKQNSDFSAAIDFLNKALKEDPENRKLQSEMFTLLLVEGRIDEAYPYALKELEADPNSLLASLAVITYHASKNDFATASEQLEKHPLKEDNAFLHPLMEVWIRAGVNDKEKALASLEKINQEGLEALYFFHSALLYDMWGEEDQAQSRYEALLAEPGGLSLRAAQAYGNFLLRQGEMRKFQALVEAYRKGAKTYPLVDENFFTAGSDQVGKKIPKSVPDAKAGMAEAFFDVSGSLLDKGNPEVSLFFTRFSLILDPSLSLSRFLLGELYERQERYDEALKLYGAEKENSETYFVSQVRMANIYAERGDLKKAEKNLRSLAEKRPDLSFPWVELGNIFVKNKKFDQAVFAFSEAINRLPLPNVRSHWSLYYSRGASYERNKQWELAEQDLLQALVLSPDQPLALNYLGYSWIERGKNIEKAKEMLERAAFMAPREGFIADSLGWAYYLTKDYAKAVSILENAVSLDPGSGVINNHLGDAYWRVGRKREARFQWTKALSVKDDFEDGDRQRTKDKLEKGLDAVGDKVVVSDSVSRKNKSNKKRKQ